MFFQTRYNFPLWLVMVLYSMTLIHMNMNVKGNDIPPTPAAAEAQIRTGPKKLEAKFRFVNYQTTQVIIHYMGLPVNEKFNYYIHDKPISPDKYASAGGRWNPTGSSWEGCVKSRPGRCQAGNLSGKHDPLTGYGQTEKVIMFEDPSLKWSDSSRGFLDKYVVIVDSKNLAIACAHIVKIK